jgi:hypothetical protein
MHACIPGLESASRAPTLAKASGACRWMERRNPHWFPDFVHVLRINPAKLDVVGSLKHMHLHFPDRSIVPQCGWSIHCPTQLPVAGCSLAYSFPPPQGSRAIRGAAAFTVPKYARTRASLALRLCYQLA